MGSWERREGERERLNFVTPRLAEGPEWVEGGEGDD